MELKTQKVAREIATTYKKTGDIKELLIKVSNLSWHFGRYGSYNRNLFLEFLLNEFKEVKE